MTPTVDELREVGLRPNRAIRKGWAVLYRTSKGKWDCRIGQRTLGEYWRRRKMIDAFIREAEWFFREVPEQDRRTVARGWCIVRGWKAWPKPGWRR